jgi:hypothetical protein
MRAKLLCVLTLAAAATAGAASAQQAPAAAAPAAPVSPSYPTGLDGYYAAAAREQAADLALHEGARSATTVPRPVFAVVGHHLVSGQLKPSERLMALVDARQPTFFCAPSQRGAEVMLGCSDGSSAQLRLDETGCGRSLSGERASMCVGLTPRYALRRLSAPAGQTLQIGGEGLVLEPTAKD